MVAELWRLGGCMRYYNPLDGGRPVDRMHPPSPLGSPVQMGTKTPPSPSRSDAESPDALTNSYHRKHFRHTVRLAVFCLFDVILSWKLFCVFLSDILQPLLCHALFADRAARSASIFVN